MISIMRIKTIIVCLVMSFLVSSCETAVIKQELPNLTFAHLTPIKLNVAKIDVIVQYQPLLRAPNVEHIFPILPAVAIKQWAKDRLVAVGKSGEAQLVIVNASVVETQLPQKKGFISAFTRQQTQRYDATVEARLKISTSYSQGTTVARATRFATVREDSSVNKRERAWFDLTEAILQDFNVVMEKNIRQHLKRWLR